MADELRTHEVHLDLDHLWFFRRTHALMLKIREEVFDTTDIQLAHLDDTERKQNPAAVQLIRDLFARLKTTSEYEEAKDDGKKCSTELLSSEQLQRIGAMMADFIGQTVRRSWSARICDARETELLLRLLKLRRHRPMISQMA